MELVEAPAPILRCLCFELNAPIVASVLPFRVEGAVQRLLRFRRDVHQMALGGGGVRFGFAACLANLVRRGFI